MREDEQQADEHEEREAAVLSAREAMYLISPTNPAPDVLPDSGAEEDDDHESGPTSSST